MFDWNGNGKHDAFDDFVTFGLVHHIIEDSKKNEQSPAQNKGRTVYSHHVKDENKTDNRSEAVSTAMNFIALSVLQKKRSSP